MGVMADWSASGVVPNGFCICRGDSRMGLVFREVSDGAL
jgi:hypothetical protein